MKLDYRYYKTIDSTNLEIKRLYAQGAKEGTVASAGTQTAGRGRTGHRWESPRDVSVATSLLLTPPADLPMEKLPGLTILAAMAVAKTIEEEYHLTCEIKWPNDILVGKRKICGILTEMDAANGSVNYVVVGIGVNVHQTKADFVEEISDMATSLDMELQKEHGEDKRASRRTIIRGIWENFLSYYQDFLRYQGSLEGIREDYNLRLVNRNKRVKIMDPAGEYEAKAVGMEADGSLAILMDDGTKRCVDSGEVHVRGLYGYV
ncbi:BirA family transcriptional regulator, biotin operon repressor / biotin-[acetyl-CoA-carboxylase] ligase [Lachnospiraceae bacterium KHCPX20]|nr:BirA family transcriptional regulator, biotin operon repressor / biotin-[acetyl-CoA-carboxylase] ligase [Lachnospiraceae bacterium KHCPX20]